MKKEVLGLFLVLATAVMAGQRTPEEAAAIAAEFTNGQPQLRAAHKAPRKAANMRLAHQALQQKSTDAAFYVFNQEDNGGYVIVSADDRTAEEILCYSEHGSFDAEKINPNLKWWLNRYVQEITALQTIDDSEFINESSIRKTAQTTAISPLLKNKNGKEIGWDQLTPYNDLCPMDQLDNTRCYTGCVATAAAQIMYKWRWPEKGTGSKTYTWENCTSYNSWTGNCSKSTKKSLTAKFGETTYDWDNMLPGYAETNYTSAQGNAVATLMYHCGIACEMAYGGEAYGGSGAWTDAMANGLVNYFGYRINKFVTTASFSEYYGSTQYTYADVPYECGITVTKMTEYFNTELEAGRPILMGGESSSSGGHEFVCDGRDASGKFHINWGWEGESNNYVTLSSLKPANTNYRFSDVIDAVIGLEPDIAADPVAVTGIQVSPNSATIKRNGRVQLTATVLPDDATDKSYTWSSNNESIAVVSGEGLVTGKTQGTATITATTKDGGFKASCQVTVTDEEETYIECDPYSYTFNNAVSKSMQLGDYYWSLYIADASYTGKDSRNNRGAQFGSRQYPAGTVSFKTDATADCQLDDITVNASIGTGGDGRLAIFISDQQVGETVDLTSAASDYTFKNTANYQGDLEIRLTNKKYAMYIKSINITSQAVPTALPTVITAPKAVKMIENGQLVILRDNVKYTIFGQKIQ